METQLTFGNFYQHPRFWRHVKVWVLLVGFIFINIYVALLYNPEESFKDDYLNLVLFLGELVLLIYTSFYAYNKLFPRRKYVLFFLCLIPIIVGVSLVDSLFNTTAIQIGALQGFWADIIIFPLFLMMAFGFKLAFHGARQLFVIQRLQAEQTESELKLLKSQINPHFLFNTLNNIYSTNLEDHEKANDIILELADLLRYQLESNKKQLTLLIEEINSVENYMALEKIRVRDCEVAVVKKGKFDQVQIVPLLLLPFVENAFKYGTGIERGKINLLFELDDNNLFTFYCKNKIVQKKGKVHSGGIGLENVKKRLALMYPEKHELDLQNDNAYFVVDLKIQL